MDILNTKINNILTEKTLKVRPENIKNRSKHIRNKWKLYRKFNGC